MVDKNGIRSPANAQSTPATKIVRSVPTRRRRNVLWPGIFLYFIALLAITLGIIGYLEYDNLVEPNMNIFVCCVPSIIIAAILIFLGFATRMNVIRTVGQPRVMMRGHGPTTQKVTGDDAGQAKQARDPGAQRTAGLKKYQPSVRSQKELISKRDNLSAFIKNLEEQHKSGLLFDEAYFELKNKYELEHRDLIDQLKYFDKERPGPKKRLKN